MLKNIYHSVIIAIIITLLYGQLHANLHQKEYNISKNLRCLTCVNESVSDSSSTFSQLIREEINTMLQNGKTETEIMDFLCNFYGEQILITKNPTNSSLRKLLIISLFSILSIIVLFITIYTYLYKTSQKNTELN